MNHDNSIKITMLSVKHNVANLWVITYLWKAIYYYYTIIYTDLIWTFRYKIIKLSEPSR